jgi:NADH-quinone oxidoreductase subunit C
MMSPQDIADIQTALGAALVSQVQAAGELTIELSHDGYLQACTVLRDTLGFQQLMDLCGVDYLGYGLDEWETDAVSSEGFSRGVQMGVHSESSPGRFQWENRPEAVSVPRRFAVVLHLLSIKNNQRIRVKVFCPDNDLPVVASVEQIWSAANWFEREAFDLFGIVFDGHPDLRRILTDYGFVGHPFRKDFPLIGNVEVRYDAAKGRVVYEPVSIEPRVGVPRVVRTDSRYQQAQAESKLKV